MLATTTTRISVNIDENVKQGAQRIFGEMGLDMTTAINLFLRTAIVEGRIPFEIRTKQAYLEEAERHTAYINAMLDESMAAANDSNTKWLSHDEMMANLEHRRKARQHVHA